MSCVRSDAPRAPSRTAIARGGRREGAASSSRRIESAGRELNHVAGFSNTDFGTVEGLAGGILKIHERGERNYRDWFGAELAGRCETAGTASLRKVPKVLSLVFEKMIAAQPKHHALAEPPHVGARLSGEMRRAADRLSALIEE